jgi:RNA polymerase sigma-70 factor, ECF subfamily
MMETPLQSIQHETAVTDEDAASIAESKINPAAFAVLYDRYVQVIYRYLYYRTGTAPEAEDLTSQTFLAALEGLPRYRHEGHFVAWLFRIARGKLIDQTRRNKNQSPLRETLPAETIDLLSQAVKADEITRLTGLIRQLDEPDRELIGLRFTAGLPFARIALITGRNENTVKKSVYRILSRLESRLEETNHG